MEFRILGPLEAWDQGREISLGRHKPRTLLASWNASAPFAVDGLRLVAQ